MFANKLDIEKSVVGFDPHLSIFDATKVTSFMHCPTGFYIEYVLGIRKQGQRDLDYGLLWHEMLETYYITRDVSQAVDLAHKRWHDLFPEDDSHKTKTLRNLVGGISSYADKYGFDVVPYFIESVGTINIGPYIFTLRPDIIGKVDGLNAVIDHKTASRNMQAYQDGWRRSPQIVIYESFRRRLCNDLFGKVDGKAVINTSFFYTKDVAHERFHYSYSNEEMSRLIQALLYHVDNMVRSIEKFLSYSVDERVAFLQGCFPSGTGCSPYSMSGCRHRMGTTSMCDMVNLGKYGTTYKIPNNYVKESWDPSHGYKDYTEVVLSDDTIKMWSKHNVK